LRAAKDQRAARLAALVTLRDDAELREYVGRIAGVREGPGLDIDHLIQTTQREVDVLLQGIKESMGEVLEKDRELHPAPLGEAEAELLTALLGSKVGSGVPVLARKLGRPGHVIDQLADQLATMGLVEVKRRTRTSVLWGLTEAGRERAEMEDKKDG
jgi:DNA-binding MarR family transcriptional regulator